MVEHDGQLPGNPGAACVWITESFKPYRTENGWLIRLGDPVETLWYSEGKQASRERIEECMRERLPLLRQVAEQDGPEAIAELERLTDAAMKYLPAVTA